MSQAIVELARTQHGVVAGVQLRAAGVSRKQLRTRVAAGWLIRLHRGVYAVAGRELAWRGRWMAAVLACGEGALLSHGSAAALWRLTRPRKGDVDLTVTGEGGRGRRDGLSIHRSRTLREEDRVIRDSIPVTSPRRTIIDLAASGMSGRPLERILTEAEYRRLLDPSAFDAGFHPGGCRVPPALRAVLQAYEPGSAPTRSELEERFLTLCRERRLPQPVVNAEVLGLIVDFLWPSAGLVVEVDGRLGHATAQGFQDDRDGDGLLVAAGFSVLRFTWRDVTERPAVVGHRVGRLLGSP